MSFLFLNYIQFSDAPLIYTVIYTVLYTYNYNSVGFIDVITWSKLSARNATFYTE